ncbi:glycosyltransferase [Allohahella marinimesophila]|uniref:Glycosyl transferase family 28 C-terminal domain-containing protein n=1 Tax=Allohahella marinimesophila TaxID=1054972 RepID=A0ABP7PBF9_9GAMM
MKGDEVFVTVGSQLPFERLIKAVDEWAAEHPEQSVFAQIGDTVYQPKHMSFVRSLKPREYSQRFSQARVVVSHVGMGTIISALELGKRLVLLPRLASLGEHRSDHQLGSARKFSDRENITVVNDISALKTALTTALNSDVSNIRSDASPYASVQLLTTMQQLVAQTKAGHP